MSLTLTPRQYIAAVGVALLIAGAAALMAVPISADYISAFGGDTVASCGTTFAPRDLYSGSPAAACREAISDRRMWAWPLTIAGLLVAAGALLVTAKPARTETADTD